MSIALPTAGRLGHLTSEQQDALAALQRELVKEGKFKPSRHDEHTLLRFLRARRFNLEAAKTMLLNCEAWREKEKVDALTKEFTFPEGDQIRALYPQYYHKVDKLGRPIYVEHLGTIDIKKITSITTMERMQQKLIFEYERSLDFRFPACSLQAGTHIEQSCTIIDLAGVSLMSFSQVASFVKQISQIGQDYYPEQLGTMFIINAPMLFSSVWSLIKPFLDEVTVKKIHILGSSYKKAVLEYVEEDNLPARLGGKCKCSGGCETSDPGPWQTIEPTIIEAQRTESTKRNAELLAKLQQELGISGAPAS